MVLLDWQIAPTHFLYSTISHVQIARNGSFVVVFLCNEHAITEMAPQGATIWHIFRLLALP